MLNARSKALLLIFFDYLIYLSSLFVMTITRDVNFHLHLEIFWSLILIYVAVNYIEGLYSLNTYELKSLLTSITRSSFTSMFLAISFIYIFPNFYKETPKTNLLIFTIINIPLIYISKKIIFKLFSKIQIKNLVIFQNENEALIIKKEIEKKSYLGLRVVSINKIPQNYKNLIIAISKNYSNKEKYKEVFSYLGQYEIIDLTLLYERLSGKIHLSTINESWFIEYCGYEKSRLDNSLKRFFDITLSLIALITLFPFSILLFSLMLLLQGKPIFYTQKRVGKNNKEFKIYKLRTMINNAESNGASFSFLNDKRITRLGKILRKFRFDELPQLINVLKGEMSLVGPRPERIEIINTILADLPYYTQRHIVKPGITGWAQVLYKYGENKEDSKEKLQYDLFYIKNKNFILDFIIIIKTLKILLTGEGR